MHRYKELNISDNIPNGGDKACCKIKENEVYEENEEEKKIKCANIRQYYTFQNKKWMKRLKIGKNIAIGRLNVVSPKIVYVFSST